ncbi:hypothetical protein [Corynebacterium xerosis]|uniref:Uncharacterized protein n=2 Tax=Corynebacterium xerosis TaxID=1725 RepID=A0A6B8TSJ6_9CORY|nr:hypothetical protein [Corynebacterium xerosis]QGS34340.1 hypothetical protein FOB82_04615 [Corynebacterium xerosis]
MTNTGMTVSPGALRELGEALAVQGHRVRGLGFLLDDDAEMTGSRTWGELLHGALLWRGKLEAEGDAVEQLGVNAGIIAAGVEECDAANGRALCPTSR